MTVAIAVAAEAATEPTEQRDDQDDDEDKSQGDMVLSFPRCGEARLSIYQIYGVVFRLSGGATAVRLNGATTGWSC